MKGPEYLHTKPQRKRAYDAYGLHVQSVIAIEKAHFVKDGRHGWEVQDSPLMPSRFSLGNENSFHEAFKSTLPEGTNLRRYVETVLGSRKGKAIGVEFGGLGSKLFSGFSNGFFERSLGVALFDSRSSLQHVNDAESDHRVITGDLTANKTTELVDRWLRGEKADFIVERMVGGLDEVPHDPYLLRDQANLYYRLLSEGGLMFVQLPKFATRIVPLWVDAVRSASKGTINASYGVYTNQHASTLVLRMHKLPGAPLELPVISPRQVRDLYKAA